MPLVTAVRAGLQITVEKVLRKQPLDPEIVKKNKTQITSVHEGVFKKLREYQHQIFFIY